MAARSQTDLEWYLDTAEREWDEACWRLEHWDELNPLERSEFDAEWPLLAGWWEYLQDELSRCTPDPEQERRIEALRSLIRTHMPQLERILGASYARLDGI